MIRTLVGWLVCTWLVSAADARAQEAEAGGSAAPMSLHAVLDHAREHAPPIRVAVARLGLGAAARARAAPDLPANPELELAGGPRVTQSAVDADLSASIIQRFEIAGEPGARRAAADRTAARIELELERVRWQVEQEVDAAYHLAAVARARAAAMRDALAFAEELAAIVERRVEIGEGAPLDVRLAQVDLAQARQAAITVDQEYLAARLTLADLAGLPVDPLPEPADDLELSHGAPRLEMLIRRAETESPDIRVLEAALAEAEARAGAAERDAWPEPWIGLQYVREGSQGPGQFASDIGMIVLGVPLPFVQLNQGDRADARAEVEIARAELESARQHLRPRIALAASAVDAAAARVEVYGTDVLPQLTQSLEMVRRAYELGELDVLEVGIARERILRLQREALDAHAAYFQAFAELEREVGAELMGPE